MIEVLALILLGQTGGVDIMTQSALVGALREVRTSAPFYESAAPFMKALPSARVECSLLRILPARSAATSGCFWDFSRPTMWRFQSRQSLPVVC